MGLVEFGVGLIPAGGGTKEMTLRASDMIRPNDVEYNIYKERFMNIAMAKVSTSTHEAERTQLLRATDEIVLNDPMY